MKVIVSCLLLSLLLALVPASAVFGQGLTIALKPNSGPVGTVVTVEVRLEIPGDPFSIFWQSPAATPITQGKAETGVWTAATTFVIPESARGSHSVYIRDDGTNAWAMTTFTITPSLSLTPTTVKPGDSVTVSGKGFAASDTAHITLDGAAIKGDIAVNSIGSFSAQVTIGKAAAGSHTIGASGNETPAAAVPTVAITITCKFTATPVPAEVGKEVTVSGDGFASGRTITLKYDDITVTTKPSPLNTDGSGSFSGTFILPPSSGKHQVEASDGAGNSVSLALTLETKPPPPPAVVSPAEGIVTWFGRGRVTFDWTDVTDPSGITYDLEVATSLSFFPPKLKRYGLTQSQYALKSGESLKRGTYYWRVRAVDGAGNKSPWTMSSHPLRVGFIPLWSLVLGGLIAFLIFIRIIRGFFRRLRERYY